MNWYYESGGKPQGPVSESLLRDFLREGKLSRHTLVWCKGMPDWKPLGEALEVDLSATPPPPSDLVPEASTPEPGSLFDSNPSAPLLGPEWEVRDCDWWSAFLGTLRDVLTRPSETFRNLSPLGTWSRPLSFYLLCSLLGGAASTLSLYVAPLKYTEELMRTWLPNLPHWMLPDTASLAIGPALIGGSLLTVLTAPIDALFSSVLLHLLMACTFAASQSLSASFRAYCYAGGASKTVLLLQLAATAAASLFKDPMLTAAAHLVAQTLAILLSIGFVSLAMARVHNVRWGRALLAIVFIPMAFAVGVALLLTSSLPR